MQTEPNFEQIVREHQAMVFRTLLRLTGDRNSVEDLAQEVFLRLYRAIPTFRSEALLTTYLYRIIVNVAQDEWKRLRRHDRRNVSLSEGESPLENRLHDKAANVEDQMQTKQLEQRLNHHLLQLSDVEQTVLVLYHQEERSYQQIAETLGIPIGTVRTHLHRARIKLRNALNADEAVKEGR